ncbi:MAG: hypothetical protein HRT61_00880 [Ekhidna sp.]|nr:hypothetical protein [Ekhidna sp.]
MSETQQIATSDVLDVIGGLYNVPFHSWDLMRDWAKGTVHTLEWEVIEGEVKPKDKAKYEEWINELLYEGGICF